MSELERIVSKARQTVARLNLDSDFAPAHAPPRIPSVHTSRDLNRRIEHTNLKADASPDDIERLCAEARKHSFYGVCVNPGYVGLAKKELSGSDCKVVTVVGFPLGSTVSRAKAAEVDACEGADEFDMVLPLGLLIAESAESYRKVFDDIREVVNAAGERPVKVILETGLLTPAQVAVGCLLAAKAGAQFVKTSTGFGPRGATVEDIWLMRACVGDCLGIKAAGGIKDYRSARILVEAGAQRIGSSQSTELIRENVTIGGSSAPNVDHLKIAVEHARSLFVFHAGQRHSSIRFFLAALTIMVGGFLGLVTSGLGLSDKALFGMIVSIAGVAITGCFWALDKRNTQLVDADEALLKRAEYEFAALTGISEFHTIRTTDEKRPRRLRYSWILPALFSIFIPTRARLREKSAFSP